MLAALKQQAGMIWCSNGRGVQNLRVDLALTCLGECFGSGSRISQAVARVVQRCASWQKFLSLGNDVYLETTMLVFFGCDLFSY